MSKFRGSVQVSMEEEELIARLEEQRDAMSAQVDLKMEDVELEDVKLEDVKTEEEEEPASSSVPIVPLGLFVPLLLNSET